MQKENKRTFKHSILGIELEEGTTVYIPLHRFGNNNKVTWHPFPYCVSETTMKFTSHEKIFLSKAHCLRYCNIIQQIFDNERKNAVVLIQQNEEEFGHGGTKEI